MFTFVEMKYNGCGTLHWFMAIWGLHREPDTYHSRSEVAVRTLLKHTFGFDFNQINGIIQQWESLELIEDIPELPGHWQRIYSGENESLQSATANQQEQTTVPVTRKTKQTVPDTAPHGQLTFF